MANQRVTELNTLTGTNVDVDNDRTYIVDASETGIARSKQIAIKELVANTTSFLQSGTGAVAETTEDALRRFVFAEQFGTFAQAVTAAANKTLIVNASTAVAANITVPATVALRFERSGKLVPASGVTVTLNCSIEAGLWQIFDKSSGGSFTAGDTYKQDVPVEWFGAAGDGSTDDTTAIQAAIDFTDTPVNQKRRTTFAAKNYVFSNLTLHDQAFLAGLSMWDSILLRKADSTGLGVTDSGSAAKISLTNIQIDGNEVNAVGLELGFNTTQWGNEGVIDNVIVRDCGTSSCVRLDNNVGQIGMLMCQTNGTGSPVCYIEGGACRVDSLVVVSTDTCAVGLTLRSGSTVIDKLHIEGKLTNPLEITGPDNYIKHLSVSAAASFTMTPIINFPAGGADARNIIEHVFVIPSTATITNIVTEPDASITWAWNASWPHFAYAQGGVKQIVLARGTATFATAASVAVALPRTAPSASYRIALCPLANETFWASAITASGFNLNSSNATSTASVQWTVVQ